MKLKGDYTLTGLGEEYVAVPLNDTNGFHGIVKLNKSGSEVFQALSEGLDENQAKQRLMEKYQGLDEITAKKAVAIVINKLSEAGLLK